jgi:hypothetical protein
MQQDIDVFNFELNDDDVAELNALNEHYSALGSLQYV